MTFISRYKSEPSLSASAPSEYWMTYRWPGGRIQRKHGVWDLTSELTITSPYVHYKVESNTFPMGNPTLESTLIPSRGLWIWPLQSHIYGSTVNSTGRPLSKVLPCPNKGSRWWFQNFPQLRDISYSNTVYLMYTILVKNAQKVFST